LIFGPGHLQTLLFVFLPRVELVVVHRVHDAMMHDLPHAAQNGKGGKYSQDVKQPTFEKTFAVTCSGCAGGQDS
jgi:hypothetical protein